MGGEGALRANRTQTSALLSSFPSTELHLSADSVCFQLQVPGPVQSRCPDLSSFPASR